MVFRLDFGIHVLQLLWTISGEEMKFKGKSPGSWIQTQTKFMWEADLPESLADFSASDFLEETDQETTRVHQRVVKVQDHSSSKLLVGYCLEPEPVPEGHLPMAHLGFVTVGFVPRWLLYPSARWAHRTRDNVPVSTTAQLFHLPFQLLGLEAVSKDLFEVVKLQLRSSLNYCFSWNRISYP